MNTFLPMNWLTNFVINEFLSYTWICFLIFELVSLMCLPLLMFVPRYSFIVSFHNTQAISPVTALYLLYPLSLLFIIVSWHSSCLNFSKQILDLFCPVKKIHKILFKIVLNLYTNLGRIIIFILSHYLGFMFYSLVNFVV